MAKDKMMRNHLDVLGCGIEQYREDWNWFRNTIVRLFHAIFRYRTLEEHEKLHEADSIIFGQVT
jgi:hypothetical protein